MCEATFFFALVGLVSDPPDHTPAKTLGKSQTTSCCQHIICEEASIFLLMGLTCIRKANAEYLNIVGSWLGLDHTIQISSGIFNI